jgi:hypothetical protein
MSIPTTSARAIASAGRARVGTVLAFAAALMLAASPVLTRAETPAALAKFAGNYAYAGSRHQGVAIVNSAIDAGMADLNAAVRLLIKKGFAEHFADVIVIKTPPGKIGIKTGELPEAITDIGKSQTFKNDEGKWLKVTRTFDNGSLIETSVGEAGTSITVYQLSADWKVLHRNVAFRSDQMEKPVKYTLDYRRK